MGTLAYIGLGSNLGDRKATLDAAVAALAATPDVQVRAVSSYHETTPVGGPPGQGAFLNAAAAVETSLQPLDLLRSLQRIEDEAGRVRAERWGARTLDLDVLLYGERIVATLPTVNRVFGARTVELTVPHPRMAVRRFVLAPLAKIAPGAIEPWTGRTIASLLANLDRRPRYVAVHINAFVGIKVPAALWMDNPAIRKHLHLGVLRKPELLAADTAGTAIRDVAGRLDARLVWFGHSWRVPPAVRRSRIDCSVPTEIVVERLMRTTSLASTTPLDAWFARLVRKLRRGRWPDDQNADRWIVSDVWFDASCIAAGSRLHGESWHTFHERVLEARSHVFQPTFAVALTRPGSPVHDRRFPSAERWSPPLGDVPLLEIESDPAAATREIVATCQGIQS